MGYHPQSDPDRSERPGSPRAGDERLRGSEGCSTPQATVTVPAAAAWAAGLSGAAAPGAVQVMGWLFPYSLMLF